jgi:hypothetical protein
MHSGTIIQKECLMAKKGKNIQVYKLSSKSGNSQVHLIWPIYN